MNEELEKLRKHLKILILELRTFLNRRPTEKKDYYEGKIDGYLEIIEFIENQEKNNYQKVEKIK